MTTPTRNTIMRLAVASACSWIALSAQAQAQGQAQAQAGAQAEVQAKTPPAGADAQVATAQDTAPAAAQAQAPAAPEAAAPVENVVTVSGSRIAARGFTQPTPTTTLSADDLAKGAQPNIFNSIAELPLSLIHI